jgi:oligopeptide/dipeptide ABC transporter ATP-binding protein
MNLLKRLQEEKGVGYLLITHDLATAIYLSHQIEIIYSGKVVESLPAMELRENSLHPYTQTLLRAASLEGVRDSEEALLLPGEVPDPLNPPSGCRFHPRCPHKMKRCSQDEPPMNEIAVRHRVRCHIHGSRPEVRSDQGGREME